MSDADDRLARAAKRTGLLALWLWVGTPTMVIVFFGWLGVASDARLKSWLVGLIVAIATVGVLLMRSLRCPRCGHQVFCLPTYPDRPWPFRGRRWNVQNPPRSCHRCGLSLAKRQP